MKKMTTYYALIPESAIGNKYKRPQVYPVLKSEPLDTPVDLSGLVTFSPSKRNLDVSHYELRGHTGQNAIQSKPMTLNLAVYSNETIKIDGDHKGLGLERITEEEAKIVAKLAMQLPD